MVEDTPSPEEEKAEAERVLQNARLVEGASWFLISGKWWRQFCAYTALEDGPDFNIGTRGARPGPVDNSDLLATPEGDALAGQDVQRLRPGLSADERELVPKELWECILGWYGGGPQIERKVVLVGKNREPLVDMYPYVLTVVRSEQANASAIRVVVSKSATCGQVKRMICARFGASEEQSYLFDYFGDRRSGPPLEDGKTLEEAMIEDLQKLLLLDYLPETARLPLIGASQQDVGAASPASVGADDEVVCESYPGSASNSGPLRGALALEGGALNRSSAGLSQYSGADEVMCNGDTSKVGVAGLSNLGNTCFMNSALQCLCHTAQFVDYFVNDRYKQEINTVNPLGMRGEIAAVFGGLMHMLWRPGASLVTPRKFKSKLSQFAPQFTGYNQQDSQELLTFLLDGLHEDLNRIIQKPYMEEKDSDGRPDEEVAAEAQMYFKARNDSIIADHFQGWLKSTLRCPQCAQAKRLCTSIKFDPVVYLSLPLPATSTVGLTVTFVRSDGSDIPRSYTLRVPKEGTAVDLLQELALAAGVDAEAESLCLVEMFNHRVYKFFVARDKITSIRSDDKLYAFWFPRRLKSNAQQFVVVTQKKNSHPALVSVPVLLTLEEDDTVEDVRRAFKACLKPLQLETPSEPVQCMQMKQTTEAGSDRDRPSLLEDSYRFGSDDRFRGAEVEVHGVGVFPTAGTLFFVELFWEEKDLRRYGSLDALDNPVAGVNAQGARDETPRLSLKDCVKRYLQPEVLRGDDMWYCPRCKEHVEAQKTLQLWSLPQVLIIHLKRFSYSRYRRDKLDVDVDFPIRSLDLSDYLPECSAELGAVYDLFAISNHYGGLGGGHYTAHVLNVDSRWYLYDDSHVSTASEKDLSPSAAYVLLYRKRSTVQTAHGDGAEEKAMDVDV